MTSKISGQCISSENESNFAGSYSYYYQKLLRLWSRKQSDMEMKECFCKLADEEAPQAADVPIFDDLKKKKLYIYGTEHGGKSLLLDLQIRGIQVEGLIDEDAEGNIGGVPCVTLEDIEKYKNEICIIIAADDAESIKAALSKRKFLNIMTKEQIDVLSVENPPAKDMILPAILNNYYCVCIYGAGEYGLQCYFLLKDSGVNVTMFCDQDIKKHGVLLDDAVCISYEKLKSINKKNLIIFVCMDKGRMIKEKILSDNIYIYIYIRENILDLIEKNLLNPYRTYKKISIQNKIDKIKKIKQYSYDLLLDGSINPRELNGFENISEKILEYEEGER